MTDKRVTLADVARRAGTSTAVVSYVLNDGPRPVSDALRARVVAALNELDYRPDRIARALRRPRRWRQIGLLVPDLRLPLFGALVGHIEVEARRRDHLTLIGNTGYDPEREIEFVGAFADSGIDGLIVVGGVAGVATAGLCAQARIPIVWVHNNRGPVDSPVVGADHVRAGALATDHLVVEHRRADVVFVGGFTPDDAEHGDRETVAQRYEGYATMAGPAARAIRTDLTPAGAYHAVSRHLAAGMAPGGLVVGTYGQAAAVIRAVTDAGVRVPADIAVVGFDGDVTNTYGQLTLTTVQQPIDAIARRALDRILRARPDPEDLVPLEVSLSRGETCGCATRSVTLTRTAAQAG
ncbi:LacI family transcriptional regulator [Nocardia transvalensis]|uniref:LacI family transcriptional regulator n=1 Tax=Nocardia transvalensis TaxID=37333 RepID=A0A7W9PM73_9NOCA|nr:LacI family DNA-binding transcriptional regulator [Nocardia transvalensis]MBB5918194.1 LacI family transcriptional regulator [Nocardia transvalensis]